MTGWREMWRVVVFLTLQCSFEAGAAGSGECTAAEIRAIKSPEIAALFVTKGRLVNQDCASFKSKSNADMLLAILVYNSPGGYESYFAVFPRVGLGIKTVPVLKQMLGFDMFPVQYNSANRLVFVHPESDANKLILYMNPQLAPPTSQLARWELTQDPWALTETNRRWVIEGGILPKIYNDGGPAFRALIESRSVEL